MRLLLFMYPRKNVFLEEILHLEVNTTVVGAFKQLLCVYDIYSILIEKYISNKKARLEYYEFRIVKIEDTYIAVEELQTDISFRSEFR